MVGIGLSFKNRTGSGWQNMTVRSSLLDSSCDSTLTGLEKVLDDSDSTNMTRVYLYLQLNVLWDFFLFLSFFLECNGIFSSLQLLHYWNINPCHLLFCLLKVSLFC